MTAVALHAARQLAWHLRTSRRLPAPAWLTPKEAELFDRMPPPDQLEGLAVASTLRSWGWGADRDLLLAGLLHDVGKSLAPAGAHWRVLMTLFEALLPGAIPRLARRSPEIAALANHPAAGASLACTAAISRQVAQLIAEHHLPPPDARMEALQQADGLH